MATEVVFAAVVTSEYHQLVHASVMLQCRAMCLEVGLASSASQVSTPISMEPSSMVAVTVETASPLSHQQLEEAANARLEPLR